MKQTRIRSRGDEEAAAEPSPAKSKLPLVLGIVLALLYGLTAVGALVYTYF